MINEIVLIADGKEDAHGDKITIDKVDVHTDRGRQYTCFNFSEKSNDIFGSVEFEKVGNNVVISKFHKHVQTSRMKLYPAIGGTIDENGVVRIKCVSFSSRPNVDDRIQPIEL